MRWRILIMFVLLNLSGCTWADAVPAPPGERPKGIPIYEVKPILIVTANAASVELVPNYNRAYGLRFGAFLAKHHFKADISQGFITKIDSNQDSTEFVKLLQALGTKAIDKFGIPGAQSRELGSGVGAPQRFAVFSFEFDQDGNLQGLRPLILGDDLIRVPNSPTAQIRTPIKQVTAENKDGETGDF